MKKMAGNGNKNQAEHLKSILKELGITTAEELDKALLDALDNMTIGIMTEAITVQANSA